MKAYLMFYRWTQILLSQMVRTIILAGLRVSRLAFKALSMLLGSH